MRHFRQFFCYPSPVRFGAHLSIRRTTEPRASVGIQTAHHKPIPDEAPITLCADPVPTHPSILSARSQVEKIISCSPTKRRKAASSGASHLGAWSFYHGLQKKSERSRIKTRKGERGFPGGRDVLIETLRPPDLKLGTSNR